MLADAYKILLELLNLKDHHIDNLQKRGFDLKTIESNGYKSWPYKRAELLDQFLQRIHNPGGIPGFYKEKNGTWHLTGSPGMVVPVRDFNGDIRSFKIRIDGDNTIGKYRTLSSNPKGKNGEEKHPYGTAAHISVHYPLSNKENASENLIITEGEIKADLVNYIKKDSYCISLPGVAMWQWGVDAAEKLKPKQISIAFDSDKNKECSTSKPEKTPFVVAKSLAMLYTTLKSKGYKVYILDWPEDCGKGIDDVLSKGFSDQIKRLDDEAAKKFCEDSLKNDLPPDWVYVIETRRFNNLKVDIHLSCEQFDDRYAPMFKNPSKECLRLPNFPRVDKQIYKPADLPMFEENGIKYLNIWKQNKIERVQGDITPFLDHVAYLLPNPDEQTILLDWLAHNIQFPGKKMMWAILLQGAHGTGKSLIGRVMRMCLGEYNVSMPNIDVLKSQYTDWFKHCSLVVLNEIMLNGRISLMEKLKPMVTDSPIRILEKFVNTYEQENYANFLFFTNYKNAITIEKTERRYCVFYSPAVPEKNEQVKNENFTKLFGWCSENYNKIYDYFMQRDLSDFKPFGDAPKTAARSELLAGTGSTLELWISEEIQNQNKPFASPIVAPTKIMEYVPAYIRGANPNKIGRYLAKLGGEKLGQFRVSSGTRTTLWCLRDKVKWQNMSQDSIVHEYEKQFKNEAASLGKYNTNALF